MRASIPSLGRIYQLSSRRLQFAAAQSPLVPIEERSWLHRHGTRNSIRSPLSICQTRSHQSSPIHHEQPTIYALSTAPGKAAIAVIRISGPACRQVGSSLSMHHHQLSTNILDRYIRGFVHLLHSPNLDTQLSGGCMPLTNLLRRPRSSTPAP